MEGKGSPQSHIVELEDLTTGPVTIDGAVLIAPHGLPPGRWPPFAGHGGRRPRSRLAQVHKSKIRFCPSCGSLTKMAIPDGDEKMRAICSSCGRVHYENPKMVVGCLVEHDNKVLLCRRKIEPAYGLWTLPAGYLEVGESAAEGASRETLEEACADVEIISPFAQLDIPLIGQ